MFQEIKYNNRSRQSDSLPFLKFKLNPDVNIPNEGDIFVYSIKKDKYLWGRVAKKTTYPLNNNVRLMLYYYNVQTDNLDIPESKLSKNNLIVPPQFDMLGTWNQFFVHAIVDRRALRKEDLLDKHIFYNGFDEKYVDDNGNFLTEKHEEYKDWTDGYRPYKRLFEDIIKIINKEGLENNLKFK